MDAHIDSSDDGQHHDKKVDDDEESVELFNKEDLNCRYYRNEWPEVGDLVMVSPVLKHANFVKGGNHPSHRRGSVRAAARIQQPRGVDPCFSVHSGQEGQEC